MRIPCLLLFSLLLVNVSGIEAQEKAISYFTMGNSLTQDTVPSKLDGDVQWHVDCGKSLPYLFENPGKPCVASSTLWPEAFQSKQYDLMHNAMRHALGQPRSVAGFETISSPVKSYLDEVLDTLPPGNSFSK